MLSVQESYIAYQNFLGSIGNQAFEGSLGMDLVVKDRIRITKLGVFDSEADGLRRTIRAELWLRDEAGSAYRFDDDAGIERIADMTFTPDDPGVLIESNRFKALPAPIVLNPGAYTIVASGYGHDEPNGNEGNPVYDRRSDRVVVVPAWKDGWKDVRLPIHALKSLDDGGAAILFVGSARWDEVVGQFRCRQWRRKSISGRQLRISTTRHAQCAAGGARFGSGRRSIVFAPTHPIRPLFELFEAPHCAG